MRIFILAKSTKWRTFSIKNVKNVKMWFVRSSYIKNLLEIVIKLQIKKCWPKCASRLVSVQFHRYMYKMYNSFPAYCAVLSMCAFQVSSDEIVRPSTLNVAQYLKCLYPFNNCVIQLLSFNTNIFQRLYIKFLILDKKTNISFVLDPLLFISLSEMTT